MYEIEILLVPFYANSLSMRQFILYSNLLYIILKKPSLKRSFYLSHLKLNIDKQFENTEFWIRLGLENRKQVMKNSENKNREMLINPLTIVVQQKNIIQFPF